MGYPKDLDDYTDAELKAELKRRVALREKGLCSYCKRSVKLSTCRYPDRHHSNTRSHK